MNPAEIPISKTKILLPKRRAELLTRKRLLESLYEVLDRKLIMVSAPAGYGKTSLLIDLAYHSDLPFCWLALDPLDRDPQRFISYFVAALTERFPQFGNRSRSTLNSLTSLEGGMEPLLVTLVNEIYDQIQEHFVLVLDDFHLLDDVQSIQYFVNRFTQLVGENGHLILSSRSLPDFSDLALLVAREQVGGIDFSDLTFTPEEIQALFAQNQQIHLSDEDARKMVEATEGWITGLQFADVYQAQSPGLNFPSPRAMGVSVFDYLGEQVLGRQTEELQLFLMQSSLLEEFDSKLCEAVLAPLYSEPQNWSRSIETIVQKNLFALPVGANGQWVRYHHLFRDFLQGRMRSERPDEVFLVLEKLAHFQEAQGGWEKAYQLYKQLGDLDALAEMIERAGIPMYQHAILTLEGWIRDLPPSITRKRPGLLSLRGVVETQKGNAAEAISYLNRAIIEFRIIEDVPGLALALVRRGNAHRFLGNYKDAIRDAEEVEQLTETKDDLQWVYADALRIKGNILFRQGDSFQACGFLEGALEIYIRVKDAPSIPILYMETGMVYEAIGNHNEAKASYERALEIWRRAGNLWWQATLLNNLGFLYQKLGEYEKAAQTFEEGLIFARQSGHKRLEALILLSMGDLYADIEDFQIAAQSYQAAHSLVQGLGERFLRNYLAIAETNLALLKREPLQARRMLDELAAVIDEKDSSYEYGLYRLMLGRLSLQNAQPQEAVAELLKAKQSFAQGGREMERVWSQIWLAAARFCNGEKKAAREETQMLLQDPNQVNHFTIVAVRQAFDWLDGIQRDREIKLPLRILFDKAGHLGRQLPRIRRQIRRMSRTVEAPASSLIIQAFGGGQVWINGRLLTMSEWQTQSVRELFFYFMDERRPLTKERIGQVLWPGTVEPSKFRLRFKNEIYRLRRAVGQDAILFDHDYYQFNPSIDHEYDVEAFEAYVGMAKNISTPAEQMIFYQKAIDLVHGHYLEDIAATWVWPERERLSQAYLSAAYRLAELYFKDGQLSKALRSCQQGLDYDATAESIYRLLMQIYHRLGDQASIIHTYQTCEKAIQKVFDLDPSNETQELYHQLVS